MVERKEDRIMAGYVLDMFTAVMEAIDKLTVEVSRLADGVNAVAKMTAHSQGITIQSSIRCSCEDDWTDGTGFCQVCGKVRG